MAIRKLFLLSLSLSSLLISNPIQANCERSNPSYFSDLNFSIDWLYWHPRRSNNDFAIPESATGFIQTGDIFSVEPDYKSGFRLGVGKSCGCVDFALIYTYFHPSYSNSVYPQQVPNFEPGRSTTKGTFVANPVSTSNLYFGRATWSLSYDELDLWASRLFDCFSKIQGRVFGGFTWAKLDQSFNVFYQTTPDLSGTDLINLEMDMNAYGLSLGIGGIYSCCKALGIFGDFWIQSLLGDFSRKWYNQNVFAIDDRLIGNIHDDAWEMLTVINLAFGLKYAYQCCSGCIKEVGLSLGYEFHHWINMPDFLIVNGSRQQRPFDRRVNFDLDGLFLRLSLGF